MADRFDVWAPRFRTALGKFAAVRDTVLADGARVAEEAARGFAPVVTGRLRESIRGTLQGTGTGQGRGLRIYLSADYRYAPIEFGSRRGHIAQRFLERGMEEGAREVEEEMARRLEDLFLRGEVGHIGPRYSGRRI